MVYQKRSMSTNYSITSLNVLLRNYFTISTTKLFCDLVKFLDFNKTILFMCLSLYTSL